MYTKNGNKRTQGKKEKNKGKRNTKKTKYIFFPSENSTLKLPISIHLFYKDPDTQLFSQTLRMSLPPDITPKPPLIKILLGKATV